MLSRAQTIEKLQSSRQYLSEHYGVSSMLLFGSVARNEQKEDSDVDVCVEMKPNLFKQAGDTEGQTPCVMEVKNLNPYIHEEKKFLGYCCPCWFLACFFIIFQ
jgi:predicted nucleotidyltransferase